MAPGMHRYEIKCTLGGQMSILLLSSALLACLEIHERLCREVFAFVRHLLGIKCPDSKADSLKNLERLWKLSKNHASMKQCMEIGEPTH